MITMMNLLRSGSQAKQRNYVLSLVGRGCRAALAAALLCLTACLIATRGPPSGHQVPKQERAAAPQPGSHASSYFVEGSIR
jgi:hypothetical protein